MHIRKATRQDLSSIATVASNAMMQDELSLWLSPQQTTQKHLHRERCLRSTIRRYNTGLKILVVILDPSDPGFQTQPDKIIGFAAFEKKVGSPDDSERTRTSILDKFERIAESWRDQYIYYFRNDLGTRKDRMGILVDELNKNEAVGQFDRFWELDILCVDPEFHRRGAGSMLIRWGQDRAREDEVPFWLWSSVKGEPLYRRLGFEDCGRLTFERLSAPVLVWRPESIR